MRLIPARYIGRATGRHRRTDTVLTLDDLLGPPAAYTAVTFPDVPVHGVVTTAWRYCGPCARDTVGVVHRDDSWTCGECVAAVSGGAL
jgi:hypothetical protein